MLTPLEVVSLYPPHHGTLGSMLASRAAVAPDRDFVCFEGRTWSYRAAVDEVERVAAALIARGVAAGDRLGVVSEGHPSTLFVLFALAQIGAALVPVNPDYGVDEALYVLSHAGVCGIVSAPSKLGLVRSVAARMECTPWIGLNASSDERDAPPLLWDAARASAPARPSTRHAEIAAGANADQVCLFIYTSGTTGFPKGVMHSQRTVTMSGEAFVQRMYLQPDDRCLCMLPLFHVNALCYSFAGALAAGATLILEPRFSASRFWRVARESGATQVNTLAAVTKILIRRPRSEFDAAHTIVKMYGAPYDEETYRVFQQEFHVPVVIEGYGMSEIPGALNNPFHGPWKVGSMGVPAIHPDPKVTLAEAKIVDDEGCEVATGQTGEIAVRTPLAMKGYFSDPAQTAAAFRDGWFMTGDLAWRDADGYFWFVARKKDIIRKRGENISGAELDRVIGSHPAVLEVAAVPVPADLGEDDILAAIVVRPGASLTAEEVGAWCRRHLAPIKVPRYVWFTDALPHTPTHRVAKHKLRAMGDLRAKAIDLELHARR